MHHHHSDGRAGTPAEWLSLTDLGRIYGISAVNCGRMLRQAGLRQHNGAPSRSALQRGLAYQRTSQGAHLNAVWSRQGCTSLLADQGLVPMEQSHLVQLWADLLVDLEAGSPSISATPADMAQEMPEDLRDAVNAELQRRGCAFQAAA